MARKDKTRRRKRRKEKQAKRRREGGVIPFPKSIDLEIGFTGLRAGMGANQLPLLIGCHECASARGLHDDTPVPSLVLPPPLGRVCGTGGWRSLATPLAKSGWSLVAISTKASEGVYPLCPAHGGTPAVGRVVPVADIHPLGLRCIRCLDDDVPVLAPTEPICGPEGWTSLASLIIHGGWSFGTITKGGERYAGPICPRCAGLVHTANRPDGAHA